MTKEIEKWLPFAMFAYNTAVNEGTNETPFCLLHGRDATKPSVENEAAKIHYNTIEDYRAEMA